MRKVPIVRIILSVVLIYFVYTETGPFTTIAFSLVMIAIEILQAWMRNVNDVLKMLAGMPDKDNGRP